MFPVSPEMGRPIPHFGDAALGAASARSAAGNSRRAPIMVDNEVVSGRADGPLSRILSIELFSEE
jgi:hypothetical protein